MASSSAGGGRQGPTVRFEEFSQEDVGSLDWEEFEWSLVAPAWSYSSGTADVPLGVVVPTGTAGAGHVIGRSRDFPETFAGNVSEGKPNGHGR